MTKTASRANVVEVQHSVAESPREKMSSNTVQRLVEQVQDVCEAIQEPMIQSVHLSDAQKRRRQRLTELRKKQQVKEKEQSPREAVMFRNEEVEDEDNGKDKEDGGADVDNDVVNHGTIIVNDEDVDE